MVPNDIEAQQSKETVEEREASDTELVLRKITPSELRCQLQTNKNGVPQHYHCRGGW